MSNPTQQVINVGAVANDGTGESLRDAFNAVNNNFANIWIQGPVGTNVLIRSNEVTTDVTNLDLKIAGNGVGNVVVASTMQPTIDGVYDLGRPSQRWSDVHAQYYYGNGSFLTGIDAGNSWTVINANGVPIVADGSSDTLTLTAGNNLVMLANSTSDTINFAVSDNPTFANVSAINFNGVNLAVSDATINGNLAGSSATFTQSVVANTANIGDLGFFESTITSLTANANITLAPNGSGMVVTAANIAAPYFIGNVVGNISGNLSAPGVNTGVVFNDSGSANAVAGFTFDKTANVLTINGNINAVNLNGTGYGISDVIADRGGDTTNWNVLLQMGTYTVNRVNWGGVTGAPLDSTVYVGLLEVKTANTQGSVLSVSQSFFPGTIENENNVKVQYNRNYWAGTWTSWVKMTNDGQQIDGGSF